MPTPRSLPRHAATRYVQPLREGGSLPAVVDTAAGGLFVVKFRGAGQGPKALIAELVVGQLAQALDLPVPELAIVELSPAFGRTEADPEIQDILRGSQGVNVGLRYLDGAFNFDATAAGELISADFATRLVWLDALVTNPDRSHRNPNLLVWRRSPWLIDHGGALYAQHDWATVDEARTRTPFARIRDLIGESAQAVAARFDRAIWFTHFSCASRDAGSEVGAQNQTQTTTAAATAATTTAPAPTTTRTSATATATGPKKQ